MSSTNRGGKRRPKDMYPTPKWAVSRLVGAWPLLAQNWQRGRKWMEPFAGDGAIIRSLAELFPRDQAPDWTALEIDGAHAQALVDAEVSQIVITNTFRRRPIQTADVVITNPPFSHKKRAVEHCLKVAPIGAILVPVGLLETAQRWTLARELQEKGCDIRLFPQRISFTNDGQADSVVFMWLTWPGEGKWSILPLTADEERLIWRQKRRARW